VSLSPIQVLKHARDQVGIRSVLLAFSTGKDSLACLDMAVRIFDRVQPYFLYWVKNLSFQERTLSWAERRYGFEILRLPHAYLCSMYMSSDYRHPLPIDRLKRVMQLTDQENAIRADTGLTWIVTGQKRADSLWRRGALYEVAQTEGISAKRRNIFPLIDWTDAAVFNYLKMARVPMPADYRLFADLTRHSPSWDLNNKGQGRYLLRIKETWPEDYARILGQFPLVAALVRREELFGPAEREARRQAGIEKRRQIGPRPRLGARRLSDD